MTRASASTLAHPAYHNTLEPPRQVKPHPSVFLEYWLDVSRFSPWKRPAQSVPWRRDVFIPDLRAYAARVYRQFDDAWSAHGAEYAAKRTADGYAIEGFIPAGALREMGVRGWGPGVRFLLGLDCAEFRPDPPDDPVWLTWIEPNLPEPDFHIRATFAPVVLAP